MRTIFAFAFALASLAANAEALTARDRVALKAPAEANYLLRFHVIEPAACPRPEPAVIRNADGTYRREYPTVLTLQMCYQRSEWAEYWTDLPENGGHLIMRVPTKE